VRENLCKERGGLDDALCQSNYCIVKVGSLERCSHYDMWSCPTAGVEEAEAEGFPYSQDSSGSLGSCRHRMDRIGLGSYYETCRLLRPEQSLNSTSPCHIR
jgi:hypothetical protein